MVVAFGTLGHGLPHAASKSSGPPLSPLQTAYGLVCIGDPN